jgi:GNAT superfamily N-acetyltransferase
VAAVAEGPIRVRRTEDEDVVAQLLPDHPHLTKPLADPEAKRFIVASRDGTDVGTCWVRELTAGTGVFGGLFVDPEHRGHGIGGRLMDAGLGELAGIGARVGMLGVHLDNEEGLALARSRGFRTVGFVPGRSTGVGALVGDVVDEVSPLPFPDRSTRLMAVWLDDERERHRPRPVRGGPITNGADGDGSPRRARWRPATAVACRRT